MKTVNCYDYCTTEDKKFICMANDILELQSSMEKGDYEFAYSVLSGNGFELKDLVRSVIPLYGNITAVRCNGKTSSNINISNKP